MGDKTMVTPFALKSLILPYALFLEFRVSYSKHFVYEEYLLVEACNN